MKPGKRLMMWMLPHATGHDSGDEGIHHRFCETNVVLHYDEEDGDGEFVDIKSLVAVRQGQGAGTQCLRMLTGMADIFGVKLCLYGRAMDDKPHSTQRLKAWYERHGFVTHDRLADSDPDPDEVDDDHHGCDFFRAPQSIAGRRTA